MAQRTATVGSLKNSEKPGIARSGRLKQLRLHSTRREQPQTRTPPSARKSAFSSSPLAASGPWSPARFLYARCATDADPTLRKALAIGADEAIRVDQPAKDGYSVAQALAPFVKEGQYDLVIAGRESIDYNGGMVPGMLAKMCNYAFVNTCVSLEIEGSTASAVREIDGGKESLSVTLPLIIGGQKGLVEESDLRIPNMRGIMQARSKPLHVKPAGNTAGKTHTKSYEKPAPKEAVTLVENAQELIDLLHNEAKVI